MHSRKQYVNTGVIWAPEGIAEVKIADVGIWGAIYVISREGGG